MDEGLINYLSSFITPERKHTFAKVLAFRTRYLCVVLEDIYQSHNASAVLRTCDCFGIQDIHIIENRNEYNINPDVTLGSNKWLNIYRYNHKDDNTADAINSLKAKGYRIVATTPHQRKEAPLANFDLNKGKAALVFGSELKGISEVVKQHADEFLMIPMFGFTESFNISVSAAIILNELMNKLHRTSVNWMLSQDEKQEILLHWLKKTIKHPELLEQEYYKTISHRK